MTNFHALPRLKRQSENELSQSSLCTELNPIMGFILSDAHFKTVLRSIRIDILKSKHRHHTQGFSGLSPNHSAPQIQTTS